MANYELQQNLERSEKEKKLIRDKLVELENEVKELSQNCKEKDSVINKLEQKV